MNELPLRDIHLPDAVSWWPPAIGWWLLPLVLVALGFAIYQLIKFKKQYRAKPAYKKIALGELTLIKQQFNDNESSMELLRAISGLLRRITLSYLPREKVASITGEQWIQQLNTLTPEAVFSDELGQLITNASYQKNSEFNQAALLISCENGLNNFLINQK